MHPSQRLTLYSNHWGLFGQEKQLHRFTLGGTNQPLKTTLSQHDSIAL